jgi:hypothetical protein
VPYSYSLGVLAVTSTGNTLATAFADSFNNSPSATPYAEGTYISRLIGGTSDNDDFLNNGVVLYRQGGGFNRWDISSGGTLLIEDTIVVNQTADVAAFLVSGTLIVGSTLDNDALEAEIGGTVTYYPPRGEIVEANAKNPYESDATIRVLSGGELQLLGGVIKTKSGVEVLSGGTFTSRQGYIYLGNNDGENTESTALIIGGSADVDGLTVYGGGYDGTDQGSVLTRVFPTFTSGTFSGYEPIGVAYPIVCNQGASGIIEVVIEGYNPRFSAGDFYPFFNTNYANRYTLILRKPRKAASQITWIAADNQDPLFPGDSNSPLMVGLGIIQGSIQGSIADPAGNPLSDGVAWLIDTNNGNRSVNFRSDQNYQLVPSSGEIQEQFINVVVGDKPTTASITLDNRGPFLVSARIWGYQWATFNISGDQMSLGFVLNAQLVEDPNITGTRAEAEQEKLFFDADQNAFIGLVAPESLLSLSDDPILLNETDGGADYELGTAFTPTSDGLITEIRYYKASSETGSHTGRIWNAAGTQVASVVFSGETSSGWQRQELATPLAVVADETYIVSVNINSHYVLTANDFGSAIEGVDLDTPSNAGRLSTTVGNFPSTTNASNYFRDIVYTADSEAAFPDPTLQNIYNGLREFQLDSINPRNTILGSYNQSSNTLDLTGQELTLTEPLTGSGTIRGFDKLTAKTAGDYSSVVYEFSASSELVCEEAGLYDFTGSTFSDGTTITADGVAVTISISSDPGITKSELNSGSITLVEPAITFSASGIGASGTFDNVRCRTSFYKRATFATTDVNTTTNRITVTGLSGRISTDTYVRFYGTDLPAPLSQEARYFVHDFSGDAFSLSSTQGGGGSQIDLTDVGSGSMIVVVITELDIQLVEDGDYSFDLASAQTDASITLSSNDLLLFQAIDWKGSLQSHTPIRSSRYYEELQVYNGNSISTLAQLQAYSEHDTFAIQLETDGYEISQLEVTGSSPTRYQWRVDASAPGLVQIESEDPDRVISSALAVLYFQFLQWTEAGIRLFRGEIEAENLNSIKIQSPEVGTNAVLTIQSFPEGIPLLVNGPGFYRTDGQTWIATGSPIQHQPTALVAVPIEVETPINLSESIVSLLHSIAAGVGLLTSSGGSLTTQQSTQLGDLAATLASSGIFSTDALQNAPSGGGSGLTQQQVRDALKLSPSAGTPDAGSIDAELDSLLSEDGSSYTAIPWSGDWDAEVQSEVADALTAQGLTSARAGYLDKLNVSGALAHSDAASTYQADISGLLTSTAFSSALPTNFADLAITDTTGLVSVGSLATDSVNANVLAADAIAEINATVDAALSDYGAYTGTPPSASDIRTEIDNNSTQLAAILLDTGTTIPSTLSGLLTSTAFTNALPTNFGALGINASGHISRVTLVDATTTNSDMRGTDSALTSFSGLPDVTVGGYATGQSPVDLVDLSGLSTLGSSDVQTAAAAALTVYDPPTRAELTSDTNSVLSAISALSAPSDATLANQTAILQGVTAIADGRHVINYTAGTATQYNTDGTVRTVFDLYQSDGTTPATEAGTDVERRPQ